MCRITYEFYKNTPYHNELMYLKLEKMLPKWLEPVRQAPLFYFDHEFAYDIRMAKKRERQCKRALGVESDNDDDDYDSEDSEEA
jgi:hypothetical protein